MMKTGESEEEEGKGGGESKLMDEWGVRCETDN